MQLWELSARECIRDLIARYNANGDAARWDELEKLFAPDAVLEVDGEVYDGRAAVMRLFRSVPLASSASGGTDAVDADGHTTVDADGHTTVDANGHTTVEEWMGRGHKPFLRHFTSTTQIDVLHETTARARSYYFVMTVHGVDHWGRYVDEFGRIDDNWVFTRRTEFMDAAFEGGWGMGQARSLDRVVRGLAGS